MQLDVNYSEIQKDDYEEEEQCDANDFVHRQENKGGQPKTL